MKDEFGIKVKCESTDAYEARIAELGNKLTETIKLLSERSRECGKLQALLEVKNRSDMSTQSTDAADVSKNGEKSTESEEK